MFDGKASYLEVARLIVAWKSPHGSQNARSGKDHTQHTIIETEVWRVCVGADKSLR